MLKKVLLLSLTMLTIPLLAFADFPLSHVQAICKVTLKNGAIIEGAILLCTGGFLEKWDTNGFLLLGERHEKPLLFSQNFKSIYFYKMIGDLRYEIITHETLDGNKKKIHRQN